MSKHHIKTAVTDHPIHELIATRFSPYAFAPLPVEDDKLMSCLEAGRWAPSSYNEQPWSLLIAKRESEADFQQMLHCLDEANQAWAKYAGVLMITVAAEVFSRNNKPNRVCDHDIGLFAGNLCLQATALGLHVHQMSGINLSKTRQVYGIPDGRHPLTAIAIGYAANPQEFSEKRLAERDVVPRSRKPLSEFVFTGSWGRPAI
jgi:nitroreductase